MNLKEEIALLPMQPGVYQFYDKKGNLLYVGKAKKLKNRVGSYFTGEKFGKTKVLVNKVYRFEYTVVETEKDALLLENNLIKANKPPYNILLKDDKNYPWICIKKEPFPRVFSTRKVIRDGSLYFGPYTSVKMVYALVDFIRKQFKIRTCTLNLNSSAIDSGKYDSCLEYHLKNCLGPCVGKQDLQSYEDNIDQIAKVLQGNVTSVIEHLEQKMHKAAGLLDFETAQYIKEQLVAFRGYQGKSTVVSSSITDVEVFGCYSFDNQVVVSFFKVVSGAIIQSSSISFNNKIERSNEECLYDAVVHFRDLFHSETKEVLLPFEIEWTLDNVNFSVPKIGEKKSLVEMANRNAQFISKDNISKQIERSDLKVNENVLKLQKDLNLENLPMHIECFDNSNIQGTNPVSACVVFKNGKPSKRDYRHFNIKTVEGPNDFASMQEAITRRYTRVVSEGESLPDMLIVDGGKGQLSATVEALKSIGIYGKFPVVGIAKRLEEIYFPEDPYPVYIDKRSSSIKLIQYMRDEAHRFGITHHRNRRSKQMTKVGMLDIPGIGEKSVEILLKEYKALNNIRNAQESDLIKLIGLSKTKKLIDWLKL